MRRSSSSSVNIDTFSWRIVRINGIAYREAGPARNVVLIHGLGMSSAYFDRFARALFHRGWSPIAPDLPGFGESRDGPSVGPEHHAEILASWADALGIRDAIWIGHSLGCNVIPHLRPDLVRKSVYIGPLWSRRTPLRIFGALMLDAFREDFALFGYVIRAYWRCGFWRWFATFRRYDGDLRVDPPSNAVMIAGQEDPLPDRQFIRDLQGVAGAHACHFAYPEAVADQLSDLVVDRSRPDSLSRA